MAIYYGDLLQSLNLKLLRLFVNSAEYCRLLNTSQVR
jgi:hypothetical protein